MTKLKATLVTSSILLLVFVCIAAICTIPPKHIIDGLVILMGIVVTALLFDGIYLLLRGIDSNG